MQNKYDLSLVIATYGRQEKLDKLLKSINTNVNIEIIIVDQNDDDFLTEIIQPYIHKFNIKHIKSKKGLSIARNKGLKCVESDIVCFPDDDCWFEGDLFRKVVNYLKRKKELSGISILIKNEFGEKYVNSQFSRNCFVSYRNVFQTCLSVSLFLRIKDIGQITFDERLGLGAEISSGEETDFVCKLLDQSSSIEYVPDFEIFHPKRPVEDVVTYKKKSYNYGIGTGYVIKSNNFSFYSKIRIFIIPIIKLLFDISFNRRIIAYEVLKGRIKGFFFA